jgi:hypothetical protein
MFRLALVLSLLFATAAFAQTGERAPRPESASNARVGGWCDALTGQKKEQCLRDERVKQEAKAKAKRSKKARPAAPAIEVKGPPAD